MFTTGSTQRKEAPRIKTLQAETQAAIRRLASTPMEQVQTKERTDLAPHTRTRTDRHRLSARP